MRKEGRKVKKEGTKEQNNVRTEKKDRLEGRKEGRNVKNEWKEGKRKKR